MNIVVTGGAGYIGSHACKLLYKKGYTPIVYDNLSTGNGWAVKWGPIVKGDINDIEKLKGVFGKYKPIAVLHFAASSYVGESVNDPYKYYYNNVFGTLTLLKAMVEKNIKSIIFSSTCAIYGAPLSDLIDEDHPKTPINPYGRSKLMVETILDDFDIAYGVKSIRLRYFNAAGADLDGEIGEHHDPETHLIPLVIKTALGEKKNITVFGNNYNTEDGTCIRDYIHVSDLAKAHILALEKLIKDRNTDYYNLGTGSGISVKEIIDETERLSGEKINILHGNRREGDSEKLIANYTKAYNQLGWEPEYGNVEIIIKSALKWHKLNKKLKL